MPNSLARAASPYLRQHQDNPVDWMEWGDAAFERARLENKLLLVSSGYAACHWCHVMAHESFEDLDTAALMNRHYVCVKVDREERPDVDQVYLDAVQLLTGRGGWPLNCFVLPDGRPVYGGTYFPRPQWRALLENLAALHAAEPHATAEQAGKITARLLQNEVRADVAGASPAPVPWRDVLAAFAARFDRVRGGTGGAPKFPMPCEWSFLLRQGLHSKDPVLLRQVRLTLDRMASGGIYDCLAGGFARYSTDAEWKVPHFEKMLYDNAQLLALYAEAFAVFGDPGYREIARGIAAFAESELRAEPGGYCSALDADSEGEEGLFYVWERGELREVLGERFEAVADLLGIHAEDDEGESHWEHGRHVLQKPLSLEAWAARRRLAPEEAARLWESARADLTAARAARVRPQLDDKVLTGWNGLMIQGLAAASRYLGEDTLLERARRAADALLEKAVRPGGGLWRRGWRGTFGIDAFLEDYAALARGLIELYQAGFEERYLLAARALADHALEHFHDAASPLLYFTADDAPAVLIRKKELHDNVIPSSNALMAEVLLSLSDYFGEPAYRRRGEAMLAAIRPEFPFYAPAYAHWAQVLLREEIATVTIAVVGSGAPEALRETRAVFAPHLLFAGTTGTSALPLLQDKGVEGKTLAYRCEQGTCGLPSEDWRDLLASEARRWTQP
ncbi:MAG: thioredoxin [Fibrobacteria bacterium]|jgi:uncharacterized protein YyaL (SSP411 family)|nr:thioredoxin [Fibrobacteria bacterium]